MKAAKEMLARDMFNLTGQVALVTGASSGLGHHFAQVLANAGAVVVLAARRVNALQETKELIEAAGGQAIVVPCDLTEPDSVVCAVASAEEAAGPIRILVNNAGVTDTGLFVETSQDDWNAIIETNLNGSARVSRAVAQRMIAKQTGGSILNVASILGLRVAGQVAAYSASKAGLIQLSKSMALELACYNIRVNALCPGYIETELNRVFFSKQAGQSLIKRIPQRRLGKLEELSGPLLLLCTDAGSYITGATLSVDGGHLVSSL